MKFYTEITVSIFLVLCQKPACVSHFIWVYQTWRVCTWTRTRSLWHTCQDIPGAYMSLTVMLYRAYQTVDTLEKGRSVKHWNRVSVTYISKLKSGLDTPPSPIVHLRSSCSVCRQYQAHIVINPGTEPLWVTFWPFYQICLKHIYFIPPSEC